MLILPFFFWRGITQVYAGVFFFPGGVRGKLQGNPMLLSASNCSALRQDFVQTELMVTEKVTLDPMVSNFVFGTRTVGFRSFFVGNFGA